MRLGGGELDLGMPHFSSGAQRKAMCEGPVVSWEELVAPCAPAAVPPRRVALSRVCFLPEQFYCLLLQYAMCFAVEGSVRELRCVSFTSDVLVPLHTASAGWRSRL